jgi:hypothetical protein
MLVELSGNDINIICVHYNNLITAQYAEIERIEAMSADEQEIPQYFHGRSDSFLGALVDNRETMLASAQKEMVFYRAELDKFSALVRQAKKAEGAGGVWA